MPPNLDTLSMDSPLLQEHQAWPRISGLRQKSSWHGVSVWPFLGAVWLHLRKPGMPSGTRLPKSEEVEENHSQAGLVLCWALDAGGQAARTVTI